jgi:hypothetical protein
VSDTTSLDRRLPTSQVAKRYDVSTRTIERWERDPALKFPRPAVVNRRKYFSELELIAWDGARVRSNLIG